MPYSSDHRLETKTRLGDELREAAMTIALQLGGWDMDKAPADSRAAHGH